MSSVRTLVYLIDYSDEWVPASTLDGWATWLHANEDGNGPGEPIAPGRRFAISIMDVTYHRAVYRDGSLHFDAEVDWTAELHAVADGDDGHWWPDDIIGSEAELAGYIGRLPPDQAPEDGDILWLAVGVSRGGNMTATFDVVDGTPVLQPDGWVL